MISFSALPVTWECPARTAEPLARDGVGNGDFHFVNLAVGWCLYDDTIANGSVIALWDCNANISNTRWDLVYPPNAKFGALPSLDSRISGSTGHCLDVPNDQVLAGLRTQLWTCNNTDAQIFWRGSSWVA